MVKITQEFCFLPASRRDGSSPIHLATKQAGGDPALFWRVLSLLSAPLQGQRERKPAEGRGVVFSPVLFASGGGSQGGREQITRQIHGT